MSTLQLGLFDDAVMGVLFSLLVNKVCFGFVSSNSAAFDDNEPTNNWVKVRLCQRGSC